MIEYRSIARTGSLLLALGAAVSGLPVGADPVPEHLVNPGPASESLAPELPAPQPFDLRADLRGGFSEALLARERALGAAADPAALARAKMDLAELYLAGVMLPEGQSVLDSLSSEGLDPAAAARRGALAAAFAIMAGKPLGPASVARADSPLRAAAAAWPDQEFWLALNAIRADDPPEIAAHLKPAVDRLAVYPAVYAEACLPLFMEAAITLREWSLAKAVAQRFDDYPALKARPAYHFLLGLAAERVGRPEQAREAYAEAALGKDVYAQRARLALVDLGLASGTLTSQAAQAALQSSLGLWRGDQYELAALERLVHIDSRLQDWAGMLDVLGRIITEFPAGPEAKVARQQAGALLGSYYRAGLAGRIPLADFLTTHRRITAMFRFDQGFEQEAELLGDRLMDLGATALAAQEYGRIRDVLEVVDGRKLWPLAPGRLTELALKQAAALARGGQNAAAAAILAAQATPEDPAQLDRLNALRAQVYSALDATGQVLETQMAKPGPEYLRLIAEANWAKSDWSGAEAGYQKLWDSDPAQFGPTDAINLLLAAYRAGDRSMALKVAQAFPDLARGGGGGSVPGGGSAAASDPPQVKAVAGSARPPATVAEPPATAVAPAGWHDVVSDLLADPPGLTPLKKESAQERLGHASEIIKRLNANAAVSN